MVRERVVTTIKINMLIRSVASTVLAGGAGKDVVNNVLGYLGIYDGHSAEGHLHTDAKEEQRSTALHILPNPSELQHEYHRPANFSFYLHLLYMNRRKMSSQNEQFKNKNWFLG